MLTDFPNPLKTPRRHPVAVMFGILIGFFVAIIGFNLVEYRAGQAVLVEVEVPAVKEIEDKTLASCFLTDT